MNRYFKHSQSILLIFFTSLLHNLAAQTSPKAEYNPDFHLTIQVQYPEITHYPTKADTEFCVKHTPLIKAQPSKTNYKDFYNLAVALWQTQRIAEAEPMFLKIVNSNAAYYLTDKYFSSDIPGDTNTNIYGYGSFTFSYKHEACMYLSKIYIEKKQFALARKYIELADKKYKEQHNCGTGYRWYREEIDGLYSMAYEGLGLYDSIIKLNIPMYNSYKIGPLIRALKKVYTQKEIEEQLNIALNSIQCKIDSFKSYSMEYHNWGQPNQTETKIEYTSGSANIFLFGTVLTMRTPMLKLNETITREHFVKDFKESYLYKALTLNN